MSAPQIFDHRLDRCKGSFLGLAIGDALGTTLEFETPGDFEPIADMVGGGPFGLDPGQWTDDTSMALCLADSLIEKGFDPKDQIERYVKWYTKGYNSSTGSCFDIGSTVRKALHKYMESDKSNPYCGETSSWGNGSLMRLAPIPIYFSDHRTEMLAAAEAMSRTTHASAEAISACKYMSALIYKCWHGMYTKEEILSPFNEFPLEYGIQNLANGLFKTAKTFRSKTSSCFDTLKAALWAFYHTNDFESGALKAVNLGDDADSVGAVYGQLAGAFYGMGGLPQKWLNILHDLQTIETRVEDLYYSRYQSPNMLFTEI